jgi:cyclic pyranopterin phosphate synthase
MPKEVFGPDYEYLRRDQILTFEEITRLAQLFVHQGVSKIRLTGGEPLVRKDLHILIKMLAEIPNLDLTLTTNGSVLARQAQALKDAGLKRVSVSLDGADHVTHDAFRGHDGAFEAAVRGLRHMRAPASNLRPIERTN